MGGGLSKLNSGRPRFWNQFLQVGGKTSWKLMQEAQWTLLQKTRKNVILGKNMENFAFGAFCRMTSAWCHRWGQVRNDDVAAREWSTWTDDMADSSEQWRVGRRCGANSAMTCRWRGRDVSLTYGGKWRAVSGNIRPLMVREWFWQEGARRNEMTTFVRSPTSAFWQFRSLTYRHRVRSEIAESHRMGGPGSDGWREAEMIGQYGGAWGINNWFLWKGAPRRDFGYRWIFGFLQCFVNKTGFLDICCINALRAVKPSKSWFNLETCF